MAKIFKYLLVWILTINSIDSFAQKPMDISLINSKLDSIILESNEIFNLFKSKVDAEKIAEERFNLNYKWLLEVKDEDSIMIKFLDSQKIVIAKMIFHEDLKNPIIINNQ